MKTIIFSMAIAVTAFAACNNNKSGEDKVVTKDTVSAATNPGTTTATTDSDSKATISINAIVTTYLQLKNALAKDNTNDAATAATSLETTYKNFDKSAFTTAQKKTFEEIADDATEHAAHIGKNGGNIAHQREHFEMLSKDIYDLVKAFGGGQPLYKDFCPMYNDGKGAYWLSELKAIKNPYMGAKMATCGIVKEEIK